MEMKPGYEMTEVGVVPEEWSVRRLGSIGSCLRGVSYRGDSDLSPRDTSRTKRLLRSNNVQDGLVVTSEVQFVNLERVSSAQMLRRNDILICMANGSKALVGKSALFRVSDGYDYTFGAFMGCFRSAASAADSAFVPYLFQTERYRHHIGNLLAGSSINNLTPGSIESLEFAFPPSLEQEAIAEALSDADALIESLEQLIAKKCLLKQGAMQELLTGKKRLPGFTGEWRIKRLGDLGATYGGLTGKSKSDFGQGSGRYVTFMNVMANVVIDCDVFERVKVSQAETQNRVMRGDLLFNGSSETPEEVGMCAVLLGDVENLFLNSFCFGFRFREGAEGDGLYLAYYFRSGEGRKLLYSLGQGAIRYNLSKTNLLKLGFPIPRQREQVAIATILSEMDAEIAGLESKVAKARQLKQGMTQGLLTGSIRLPLGDPRAV